LQNSVNMNTNTNTNFRQQENSIKKDSHE